jgi:hypothetical protein
MLADMTLMQWAIPLALGLWGGVAGYCSQILSHRRKFSWADFFMRAVVSGFAGVNAYLMTGSMESELYRAALVGMAGWLGMESLAIIRNISRVKIMVDEGGKSAL